MLYSTNTIKGLEMYSIGQVVRVQGAPGTYLRRMQLTVLPGNICKYPQAACALFTRMADWRRFNNEITLSVLISICHIPLAPCNDPNDETVFRLRVLKQERTAYTQEPVLPEIILKEAVCLSEACISCILQSDAVAWVLIFAVSIMAFLRQRLGASNRTTGDQRDVPPDSA